MIKKKKIIRSRKHQMFVAKQPCIICRTTYCVQCCHIRSIPKYGNVGKGVRNDAFCVSMCFNHHLEQHEIGEYNFYTKYKKNPIAFAEYFCKISNCKKIKTLEEGYFNEHREYYTKNPKDIV